MANESHPINELMDSSMQNLRSLVDADTVIGEPITTPDGTIIIPISKISFGFVSGGSDLPVNKQGELFGGGAGGGVTVNPLGFLVIKEGGVELLQMNNSKNTTDRLVSLMPEMVDKIAALFPKKERRAKSEPQAAKSEPNDF